MSDSDAHPCSVLLLTTLNCPHCAAIEKIFQDLINQNKLNCVNKYDLAQQPLLAEQYNVRSVPWFKINELEFSGLYNRAEIEFWVANSENDKGILQYIIEGLESGRLAQIEKLIAEHPAWLSVAVHIVENPESPIQAKIGFSALLEGLHAQLDTRPENTALLQSLLPALTPLLTDSDHRVRSDVCHYLSLIPGEQSEELLKTMLSDPHSEVRELAEDGLVTKRAH